MHGLYARWGRDGGGATVAAFEWQYVTTVGDRFVVKWPGDATHEGWSRDGVATQVHRKGVGLSVALRMKSVPHPAPTIGLTAVPQWGCEAEVVA